MSRRPFPMAGRSILFYKVVGGCNTKPCSPHPNPNPLQITRFLFACFWWKGMPASFCFTNSLGCNPKRETKGKRFGWQPQLLLQPECNSRMQA